MTAARRADQVMPDPVEHATGETLLENWLNEWVRSFSSKIERLVENTGNETFLFRKVCLKFCLLRS